MTHLNHLPWQLQSIIGVANSFNQTGSSWGSTGEQIAAAFVLNDMAYLPSGYTVVEAWERLGGEWQRYVKVIQSDYMHLIKE